MMKKIPLSLGLLMAMVFTLGQVNAKEPSPTSVPGATTVDTDQAKQLWLDGAGFLDPRKDADWNAGHIPEAVHLDIKDKTKYNQANVEKAFPDKSAPIVAYCNGHSCHRSSHAAADLVKWGYKKVYYYRDGFPAWKAAGNPVE